MSTNTTTTPANAASHASAFSLMLTDAYKIPSACTLVLISVVGSAMSTNTTTTPANAASHASAFSLMLTDAFKIPSACTLVLISVVGTVTNLLTCVSFLVDSVLRRRVYDFFIFNLAISDLLVCCVSIPLYIAQLITSVWPFSRGLCKFWLVEDWTMCSISSITVMILSADRLVMVYMGARYNIEVTMRRARVVALVAWLCAFLMYGPVIIWWDVWSGKSSVKDVDCYPEFMHDYAYTLTLAVIDTTIPMGSLLVINGLMYYKLWVRTKPNYLGKCVTPKPSQRCSTTHQSSLHPTITQSGITRGLGSSESLIGTSLGSFRKAEQSVQLAENSRSDVPIASSNIKFNSSSESLTSSCQEDSFSMSTNGAPKRCANTGSQERSRRFRRYRPTTKARINVKAAKLLSSIVLVYFICWGPFAVTSVTVSIHGEESINPVLYQAIVWLLWVKSVVNPFLYSYNCKRYRMNFKRILLCQWCRR